MVYCAIYQEIQALKEEINTRNIILYLIGEINMNILINLIASIVISAMVFYLLLKRYLKKIDKITTEYLDEIKSITINKP